MVNVFICIFASTELELFLNYTTFIFAMEKGQNGEGTEPFLRLFPKRSSTPFKTAFTKSLFLYEERVH